MSANIPMQPAADAKRLQWRAAIGALLYLLVPSAVMFIAAGRWDWWMGWAYILVTLIVLIGSRVIVARTNPDLLRERARSLQAPDVKSWDRTLVPLVVFVAPLFILLVAGLDLRLGWQPEVPPGVQIAALLALISGYLLAVWAMLANRYFSAYVRIQGDRGQSVVTDGPYRGVRHPAYAGGLISNLALPIMLGSLWALIPALLGAITMIVRTALEDRTLQAELPGYAEYARKTRYRLLPGVW